MQPPPKFTPFELATFRPRNQNPVRVGRRWKNSEKWPRGKYPISAICRQSSYAIPGRSACRTR
jgi:hypothetical protein